MWPFRRNKTETRSIDTVPWGAGGASSAAVSQSRALSLVPVFSATSLLAKDISTLPIKSYRRIGDRREPMSKLPTLFDILVSEGRLVQWLHRAMTSMLLRGNAYGLVLQRDGFGFPTVLEWLNPDEVTVIDSAPSGPGSFLMPLWYWRGRNVPTEDIVHIPWFTLAGKVQGLSPIAAFAATIGAGLHVVDYGNSWFEGGGFPPGTFKNANAEIDQTTAEAMGARLDVARRRRRPLVYGKDWEYTPISVPPNEAQFIEATKLNATTIASIYHIPPEWVGGSSGTGGLHYTTAEQDQITYVQHAVRPFVETLECAFAALLPEKQYVKLSMDALLRADLKTRHEVYQIDAGIGLRTIDEMRALEELPPLPPQAKPPVPPSTLDPAPTDTPSTPPVAPSRAMSGPAGLAEVMRRRDNAWPAEITINGHQGPQPDWRVTT